MGFHKNIAPNSTVVYRLEGCGVSYWNADGVRSRTNPPYRSNPILAIGDSFTEALQVDDNEVYTSILEKRLETKGNHSPILNLGFSGGALPHYIANADRYKSYFSPEWAIIQLRDPDLTTEAWGKDTPHFCKNSTNDVIECVSGMVANHPTSIVFRIFISASRLFSFPRYAYQRVKEFDLIFKKEAPLFKAGYVNTLSAEQSSDLSNYPIAQEIELVRKAYDGRLTILYIAPYDPKVPMSASPMETELSTICRRQGISFVTTRSLHARFIAKKISPFGFPNSNFNVGHCNHEGHQAIAELLSDELAKVIKK